MNTNTISLINTIRLICCSDKGSKCIEELIQNTLLHSYNTVKIVIMPGEVIVTLMGEDVLKEGLRFMTQESFSFYPYSHKMGTIGEELPDIIKDNIRGGYKGQVFTIED